MIFDAFADLLGTNNDSWATHPERNCAIPPDYTGIDVRVVADQWFPTNIHETTEAKRLCHDCPVINQCLAYALPRPELEGIWGGTSQSGRAMTRHKQRETAA